MIKGRLIAVHLSLNLFGLPLADSSQKIKSAVPKVNTAHLSALTARGGKYFSNKPIDLSVLGSFDADLKLKASGVSYGKIFIDKLDAIILVKKGTMKIPRLTGGVFDGDLKASLELATGVDNRVVIRGEIDAVNIEQVFKSVTQVPRLTAN